MFIGSNVSAPNMAIRYGTGTSGGGASYLLDTYTAYAAYDVAFQLKSDQTQMIEVRESGGGTYAWIGPSGGVLDQVALLAHTGSNNGLVRTVKDAQNTASTRDISQSTDAKQPKIVSSGVVELENGKPKLLGSSGTVLVFACGAIAQPISYIGVANLTNNNARLAYSSNNHEVLTVSNELYLDCGAFLNGGTGYSLKQSIISVLANGTSSALRGDGNSLATGNAGATGITSSLY